MFSIAHLETVFAYTKGDLGQAATGGAVKKRTHDLSGRLTTCVPSRGLPCNNVRLTKRQNTRRNKQ